VERFDDEQQFEYVFFIDVFVLFIDVIVFVFLITLLKKVTWSMRGVASAIPLFLYVREIQMRFLGT